MRATGLFVVCLAGCLDSFTGSDLATDLGPADLRGADYTGFNSCSQLNACLVPCQNQICVNMCRGSSTPTALMKEDALQACFDRQCGGPCTPDKTAPACQACIANAQAGAGVACNPSGAPECHQCVNEAVICRTDTT